MKPIVRDSKAAKEKFSLNRVLKTIAVILAIAALALGVYFFVTWRPVKIWFASIILNEHRNFLACEDLPFYPHVQTMMSRHGDVLANLKAAGALSVDAVLVKCPSSDGSFDFNKGELKITYQTRAQKQAIEKLIGDNFFGVPYNGYPR